MNSVQRAIFFSAVERYASVVLFFVSTAVLARLLTPKEFGIYAVVTRGDVGILGVVPGVRRRRIISFRRLRSRKRMSGPRSRSHLAYRS